MLSQRQSAHLGLCAAAILVVSCVWAFWLPAAGDRNAANTDQQKSVSVPQPQHVSTAGLSAA